MAMQDRKMEDRFNCGEQTMSVATAAFELTHSEDYARNGDYLGRQPGDVSGRNHFDTAMQELKTEDRPNTRPQTVNVAPLAAELTHSEDYARNGDYLGRQPGDVSGRNHFDEEYFVDESENENEAEVPAKEQPAKRH